MFVLIGLTTIGPQGRSYRGGIAGQVPAFKDPVGVVQDAGGVGDKMSEDSAPASIRKMLTSLAAHQAELQTRPKRRKIPCAVTFHPSYGDLFRRKMGKEANPFADADTRTEAIGAATGTSKRPCGPSGVRGGLESK